MEGGLEPFIRELQVQTGRYGDAEKDAWCASLTRVAGLLGKPQMAAFQAHHLHLGQRGNVAVEYRLPASSSWCDVVLLGRGPERSAAVILELKDWTTAGDRSGPSPGLIERHGNMELHPAEQVRGYVEYCRRFHSAVQGTADVHGAVYFTRAVSTSAYVQHPHVVLTTTYRVFADAVRDIDSRFPKYLAERLTAPMLISHAVSKLGRTSRTAASAGRLPCGFRIRRTVRSCFLTLNGRASSCVD